MGLKTEELTTNFQKKTQGKTVGDTEELCNAY